MHGGLVLPKARTFSKDKVAWMAALALSGLIYFAYLFLTPYQVVDTSHISQAVNDPILLVLSYGRVTKSGDGKFIAQAQLQEHLNAIHAQGFVPVSIEQVKNFYLDTAPLPAKSVLLVFEREYLSTYENVDPVLRDMRWRATMSVSTQRIQERNTTFLYWDRLQRMLNSGLWDIASAGHAGYDHIPIDREGKEGHALFHRRWLPKQSRHESDLQFRARIHQNYSLSKDLLEKKLSGFSTLAYVSPFRALSKPSRDPHILKTNQDALRSNYPLGFVGNEFGINDRRSYPYRLVSRRITPDWSAQMLKKHIVAVLNNPIITGQLNVATTDWVEGVGKTEYHGNKVLLRGGRRADMWVPGGQRAEFWKIEAEVKIDGNQQFWIVQYDAQTPGAFWRFGGDARILALQHSPKGEKIETIRSFKKSMSVGEYHRIALIKRGQGIWVEWDNEPLSEHPVYLPGQWQGKVGWIAWNGGSRTQLELQEPQLTLLPLQVQAVNAYPSRREVQQLTKQASQLGALAFPRWRYDKGQFNTLDADDDLLRFLAHRYGWKLIPTICIAPDEIRNPTWDDELNSFVQTLPDREVHLDLRHISEKIDAAKVSRISAKFAQLDRQFWFTEPSASTEQSQRGSCNSIFRSSLSSLKKQPASST